MGRPAILKVDIVADAKGVGSGVNEAESKFGKLGRAAGVMGKAVGLGLVAAGTAAVGLGVASIKSASDVEQAFGSVDAVFGKSSGKVKDWANNAASSVGLAKAEYANLAAVIGSQLGNMGMSQDQSAAKTKTLIGLGADLAATYGGTTSEAVQALSSVLKGETDPIERYGVSIKQSDINARLAAEGLTGLTGTAAKQATAAAVLGLVTEQTSKAHGQFQAQTDTLAVKQQQLTAKWENAKATLGQHLLPAATAVAGFFLDRFMPAASQLASNLGQRLGPTITAVGGFITGTLVPAGQALWKFLTGTLVPAITTYVTPVLAGIRSAFHQVSSAIDGNSGNLKTLAHFLGVVVPPVAKVLAKILGTVVGTAFRALGFAISAQITVVSKFIGVIRTAVDWLDRMIGLASRAKSFVSGGFGLGSIFSSNAGVVGMVGRPLVGAPSVLGPGPAMATASLGSGSWAGGGGGWSTPAGSGGVYVDRRQVNVRIEGALDPVAVAVQLENVLRAHQVRTGRALTYGTP